MNLRPRTHSMCFYLESFALRAILGLWNYAEIPFNVQTAHQRMKKRNSVVDLHALNPLTLVS